MKSENGKEGRGCSSAEAATAHRSAVARRAVARRVRSGRKLQGDEPAHGICMPFGAIGHQALASESKGVQVSRTIIFAGLTLTGLTGARFPGSAGLFFDNSIWSAMKPRPHPDLLPQGEGIVFGRACHVRLAVWHNQSQGREGARGNRGRDAARDLPPWQATENVADVAGL